jgi:hypothetical protein
VLKECGSRYQAKKAANELAGQSWQDFLKECRATLAEAPKPAEEAKPAEAAAPADAAKPAEPTKPVEAAKPAEPAKPVEAAKPAEPAKPAVDSKAATKARQTKCAAEWKEKKAELVKEDKKLTWPKFWSACNKRLKDAGE